MYNIVYCTSSAVLGYRGFTVVVVEYITTTKKLNSSIMMEV